MPALVATKICGAKTRAGTPCPNPAVTGRERCRMHGGKTLQGYASPNFVHGRRSRPHTLPSRLATVYTESLSDPELLALRNEIALTDARIQDLLDRVDSGESGELWKAARLTYREAQKNQRHAESQNPEKKRAFWDAFDNLGSLLAEGSSDYQAWEEVNTVVEQRRRLAATEQDRLKKLQEVVTPSKGLALVKALITCIHRNVPDRSIIARIQADFIRLVEDGDNSGTLADVGDTGND